MDNNEKFSSNVAKSIVKTLLYSDMFNYPLTKDEVWKFLISNKKIKRREFDRKIMSLNSVIFRKDEFLYMKGKILNISKRRKKYFESVRKMKLAKEIAQKLSKIPTVLLIGISGNLSMMAASYANDIDFFVVAQKNKVWLTRLLLILYLKILRKHRRRGDKNFCDKVCLNMIIGENKLALSKNFRNLYTAHEIAQLKPILERNNTYNKFIKANRWMERYLPNVIEESKHQKVENAKKFIWENLLEKILSFSIFEVIAREFQVFLMKKNITREIIEKDFIALHPKDYKSIILSKYYQNLLKYGL